MIPFGFLRTGGLQTRPYIKILIVLRPMAGIFDDVTSNYGQFALVADYAIVEGALPLEEAVAVLLIYFPSRKGLKTTNDLCQGIRTGGLQTRPYDFNNPVGVVGHDHEFVQPAATIMIGQIQPALLDNEAIAIHLHTIANDFSQYFFFFFSANGHEIEPLPGVVDALLTGEFALPEVRGHVLS
jgi:hypothetical protein